MLLRDKKLSLLRRLKVKKKIKNRNYEVKFRYYDFKSRINEIKKSVLRDEKVVITTFKSGYKDMKSC